VWNRCGGPCQRNDVGMAGSNDVRAWGQILGAYYLCREVGEKEDWHEF